MVASVPRDTGRTAVGRRLWRPISMAGASRYHSAEVVLQPVSAGKDPPFLIRHNGARSTGRSKGEARMATARDVYRAHPTQAEIDDVLGKRSVAALGTLNDDGSIHLAYLLFLFEDGRFLFETSSDTSKARNLAARGTASVIIHGRASTGRSLMVEAEGSARLIAPPDAHAANHRLRAKYILADALDAVDRAWGHIDDVAIELTPQRWRSWTGTVLAEATEASTGRDYETLWKAD
jgi:PPOX class probable F420-dependent enzyme